MSDEWQQDFEVFSKDMGVRLSKTHTVERIDNSKGYSKDNCKWATPKEQAANRDSNVWFEYRNERKTISQWAEEIGIAHNVFEARLEALFRPVEKRKQKVNQGGIIYLSVKDAFEKTGVSQAAIRKCLCGHNATAGGLTWEWYKD